MFLTIKSNSNDRKTTKHTRARVHTTHTRLFRTRTTVPLHQETERSTLLVRGHGEMYVGKTTMHRTKIKSSLRRWSFLSSSFFVQSSACVCTRNARRECCSYTENVWAITRRNLVSTIARPFLVDQSLTRALSFTACKVVLWKWPSRYSHWLELFVEIRVFKNTTCNRQSRRSRCSYFFFFLCSRICFNWYNFVRSSSLLFLSVSFALVLPFDGTA